MITLMEMYEKILANKKDISKSYLAMDEKIPEEILQELANAGEELVLSVVLENSSAPKRLLKQWEQNCLNGNTKYLYSIAKNPSTSAETLRKLYEIYGQLVEIGLSKNPNTPVDILEKLEQKATDLDELLAENPSSTGEMLKNIEQRERGDLKHKADIEIDNEYDERILEMDLYVESDDWEKAERKANSQKDKDKEKKLKDLTKESRILSSIASNKATPKEMLEKLFKEGYWNEEIAINPSTPEDILRALYKKRKYNLFLAQNPSTPVDILEKMFKGGRWNCQLAENPSTPEDILRKLYQKRKNNSELAENPSTPVDILEELLDDENLYKYLIRNPKVQELVREKETSERDTSQMDTMLKKIHGEPRVEEKESGQGDISHILLMCERMTTEQLEMLRDRINSILLERDPEKKRLVQEVKELGEKYFGEKEPECAVKGEQPNQDEQQDIQ